jgi:hypothetical protein
LWRTIEVSAWSLHTVAIPQLELLLLQPPSTPKAPGQADYQSLYQ